MVAHTPISDPRPQFAPSPSLADQVLAELADPSESLRSIARVHNTSPEALSLWLSSPEISERIAAMRSSAALRTRWLATDHLPACAELSARVVRAALANPDPAACDSALRAARVLLRLASFDPNARTRSPAGTQRETNSPHQPLRDQLAAAFRSHRRSSNSTDPLDLEALLAEFDSSPPQSTPEPASDSPPEIRERVPLPETQVSESTQPEPEPSAEAPEEPALHLPPGLLASILPSFESPDLSPFHPERRLRSAPSNQRTLIKLRLKQQRKQVIEDAIAYLLRHNHCTAADLPAARREIERFYLHESRPSAAPRSPP